MFALVLLTELFSFSAFAGNDFVRIEDATEDDADIAKTYGTLKTLLESINPNQRAVQEKVACWLGDHKLRGLTGAQYRGLEELFWIPQALADFGNFNRTIQDLPKRYQEWRAEPTLERTEEGNQGTLAAVGYFFGGPGGAVLGYLSGQDSRTSTVKNPEPDYRGYFPTIYDGYSRPVYVYERGWLGTSFGEKTQLPAVGEVLKLSGEYFGTSSKDLISFANRPLYLQGLDTHGMLISKSDVIIDVNTPAQFEITAPRIFGYDPKTQLLSQLVDRHWSRSTRSCLPLFREMARCSDRLKQVARQLRDYLGENAQPDPKKVAAIQNQERECQNLKKIF